MIVETADLKTCQGWKRQAVDPGRLMCPGWQNAWLSCHVAQALGASQHAACISFSIRILLPVEAVHFRCIGTMRLSSAPVGHGLSDSAGSSTRLLSGPSHQRLHTKGCNQISTAALDTRQERRIRDSRIKMIPLVVPDSSLPPIRGGSSGTATAPPAAPTQTRPSQPAERRPSTSGRSPGNGFPRNSASQIPPRESIREARNAASAMQPDARPVPDSDVSTLRRSAAAAQPQAEDAIGTAARLMTTGREGSLVVDADFAESGKLTSGLNHPDIC